VSIQKSNLTLNFLPRITGEDVITLDTFDASSHFHCDQITADFYDHALSVSLTGFFDSGARVRGELRSDTESKVSILKFLENELSQRKRLKKQTNIDSAVRIVELELEKATSQVLNTRGVVADVLKVYAEDFEWSRDNIDRRLRMFPKGQGKGLFYELSYSSISSFLSIETIDDSKLPTQPLVLPFAERLSFSSDPLRVIEKDNESKLCVDFRDNSPSASVDVTGFFRVRTQLGEWQDLEAKVTHHDGQGTMEMDLEKFPAGAYEATAYLRSYFTGEIIWKGQSGENFSFTIEMKSPSLKLLSERTVNNSFPSIRYGSYSAFNNWCFKNVSRRGFGSFFLDTVRLLPEEDQKLVFSYYSEALRKASKRKSVKSSSVLKAFRLLGVSDVFMVTPEGPHAMAGGLCQVIVGLSAALTEENCYVTIVSPLYAQENGNHHDSARNLLDNGLDLYGKNVKLKALGSIYVNDRGTKSETEVFRLVEVFEAVIGKLRFLFIKNDELADRLYGGISGSDALRRSTFLSQAALELINQKSFNCNPDVILTHDWTTALVRPIQRLNPKFNETAVAHIPVIHLLHNAGEGYQGRFSMSGGDKEIWDILGLKAENYGGFLEDDKMTLNLSKGACFHNIHGLLTVSKPYADQISESTETNELSKILSGKRDILYGVSNGIPTKAVREAAFGKIPDRSLSELLVQEITPRKIELKKAVQRKYGLEENPDLTLAVLVGRLTEQKGLSLLTSVLENGNSVLQEVLENNNLQIIIAGPPSKGDLAFSELEDLTKYLEIQSHNRFRTRFEFVPHSEAIELTAAADLFLMPSKYEPGGITQLEALAVGTSVVAHRVGGLSATLSQYTGSGRRSHGNSFLFDSFDPLKFLASFEAGCRVMSDPKSKANILKNTYLSKNDWRDRVSYYLSLFQRSVGVFSSDLHDEGRFQDSRLELLSKVTAKS